MPKYIHVLLILFSPFQNQLPYSSSKCFLEVHVTCLSSLQSLIFVLPGSFSLPNLQCLVQCFLLHPQGLISNNCNFLLSYLTLTSQFIHICFSRNLHFYSVLNIHRKFLAMSWTWSLTGMLHFCSLHHTPLIFFSVFQTPHFLITLLCCFPLIYVFLVLFKGTCSHSTFLLSPISIFFLI